MDNELNRKDVETLKFIYKRMENLYSEDPRYDHMENLQKIIEKVEESIKQEEYLLKFKKYSKALEKQLQELKDQLSNSL